MKYKMYAIGFSVCLMSILNTGAQEYKTLEDTVNLNKEMVEVSNDIASLTAKLAIAQNNLPQYKLKAVKAESNAQDAAINSSEQAIKAKNGSVKEAKKAKRQSKKAYREAKDARSANKDISEQNDRIVTLTGQLAKKQERLQQLTAMRNTILAQHQEQ